MLSNENDFLDFLDNGTSARRKEVESYFLNLSKTKGLYDQVRYLDATGMEIIRVDYRNGSPAVIPANELQDKSGRYFFRDSIKLKQGEIYVSPLDLNIEHNQIESPYKPMIRFGLPVFDHSGQKKGVVLLNYFGSKLLGHFKKFSQSNLQSHSMLLNREGFWLSSLMSEDEWGFMFKNDRSFPNRFPYEWKTIATDEKGTLLTANGMFTFVTTYPLSPKQLSSTGTPQPIGSSEKQLHPNEYYWKTVLHVPSEQLPAARPGQYQLTTGLFLVSLILLGLGSAFLAHSWTARGHARAQLAESQARLQEITTTLGEGVYVIDEIGCTTYVNPEAERMLGWSQEELLGQNAHERFHYKRADGTICAKENCGIGKVISSGNTYRSEDELFWRKDNTSFPVQVCSTPIVRTGKVIGSVVAFSDITSRKRAEAELWEAKERLEAAAAAGIIGVWDWDVVNNHLVWDKVMYRLYGIHEEDFGGAYEAWVSAVHPEDKAYVEGEIQAALHGEREYAPEFRVAWPDGSTRYIKALSHTTYDDQGIPLRMIGINYDLTEQKHKEQALRDSEERFRLTFESAAIGMALVSLDGHFLQANPAMSWITGYSQEELLEKTLQDVTHPDDRETDREFIRQLLHGERLGYHIEKRLVHKKGHLVWTQMSTSVVVDVKTHQLSFVVQVQDISERKIAVEALRQLNETLDHRVKEEVEKNFAQEQMLIQQSRLAAMGEMIGNIAHQWRQPLNALGLLIANIKDAYDYNELDGKALEKTVAKGSQYIQKMSSTIDDFRNFFKPNKQKALFKLEQPILEALNLLNHSLKSHNISIQVESDPEAQAIGFPNEFSQVVLNVINNAKDAILERIMNNGAIHISIGHDTEKVWATIKDNAGGIPEDVLPKIFDPYFTTKEKGTGIGLYMSRMILEHMDGTIDVRNCNGGAEFRLTLPTPH